MSSKLSVGIHLLTILALCRDRPFTSGQLAESANTNPVVIRRILGLLREAGFVESRTGVGGGWALRVEPERINFLDVFHAVEPHDEMFALHKSGPNPKCPVGGNICSVLTEIYAEVQSCMARQLASTTLARVLERLHDRQGVSA